MESPSAPPDTRRLLGVVIPCAVFVVTFACFQPALSGQFVNWDDERLLVKNPDYRGFSGRHLAWMFTTFHMGHYHPLTWLSFALDHALWGMNPGGYHLTNLLLHAANAVLFYLLILALVRAARGEVPDGAAGRVRLGAAFGALLFSVHPLRVESVAWVTERRDVLSGLFLLLTLLAYLRAARAESDRWKWHAVAWGCLLLSLLSKAWGMTLPVVLLAIDAYPMRRWIPGRRRAVILEKLPYLALALGAAILAAKAQEGAGAMALLERFTIGQRTAQASYGLLFYVWKTLAPFDLHPVYLRGADLSLLSAKVLLSALAVLAAGGALFGLRRRYPAMAVAAFCYGVVVSPVLGFVQSGPQMAADRYTYLSCLPFAVLAGIGIGEALACARRNARAAVLGASGLAVLLLGVGTLRQSAVWKDSVTLFQHVLRIDPGNYLAWDNLGAALTELGRQDEAMEAFNRSIRFNPRYHNAYHNRAQLLIQRGKIADALKDFDRCIAANPNWKVSYVNRALARHATGDTEGAISDLTAAIRIDPALQEGYLNRGALHKAMRDWERARSDFEKVIELAPEGPRGYGYLGSLLHEQGRYSEAISEFGRALERDRAYAQAYVGRARSRAALKEYRAAAEDYEEALRRAPERWPPRAQVETELSEVQRLMKE